MSTKRIGSRSARAGLLAMLVALVGLVLPLAWAPPAQAASSAIDPDAATELIVHKLEQPEQFGLPASGLPQDTSHLTPIGGVEFSAKRVPGVDLTTAAGWTEAVAMTPQEAAARVAGEPVAASGTTGAAGELSLALRVGLYYVEEGAAPAGVVASAPFLVALPLDHPAEDSWLYTVHVYPKNARVAVSLEVRDADAVKIGDTVRWISRTTLPRIGASGDTEGIDGYVVQNLVHPDLRLIDSAEQVRVALRGSGAESLTPGDYVVRIVTVGGRETVEVEFTESGRQKLDRARAADPAAEVTVSYRTAVLAEGELTNEVRLLPDARSIAGEATPLTAEATTKFGPLAIVVHERGNPQHLIPGAKFKLYLSAEDAAAGRNAIEVDGVSEWTTDEQGRIVIHGLRLSDFVNGLDRESADPLFRSYYVILTHIPPGYTGESRPIAMTVVSTTEPQLAVVRLWRGDGNAGSDDNAGSDGTAGAGGDSSGRPTPEDLPITGGQIAGSAMLGALLLVGGAALVLRRRGAARETETGRE